MRMVGFLKCFGMYEKQEANEYNFKNKIEIALERKVRNNIPPSCYWECVWPENRNPLLFRMTGYFGGAGKDTY